MKEKKTEQVTVRLTQLQKEVIQQIVTDGKASSTAGAVQYVLNQFIILKG